MSSWLDLLNENAARPLLARLRTLDDLTPSADLTPDAVLAALDDGEDLLGGDAARGLVRLVAEDRWLDLARALADHDEGHYLSELLVLELDFRVIPAACAALLPAASASLLPAASASLDGPDARFALRVLGKVWDQGWTRADFEPAWPAIERRITDREFETAYLATELVTRARRHPHALLGALARALTVALEEDDSDVYDAQVSTEDLLFHIAHSGVALHGLAPSLEPFLRCGMPAWRSSAILAAIGIGADSLRAAIELGDDDPIAKALSSYASWLFGGGNYDFAQAAEDLITQSRIGLALEVSPVSDRLLAVLGELAVDPRWSAFAYRALARHGARAEGTLRALPELAPDHDAFVWDCEARLRCGVRSRAETCRALDRALEPESPFHVQAWQLYLELADEDDTALARVRAEAAVPAGKNAHPCGGALLGEPRRAARVLPELIRGGHDEIVLAVHRAIPSETFWARARGEEGKD